MNKETTGAGGVMIFLGVTIWISGRICGGYAVFAPLIAVVGVIVLLAGLCSRGK